MSCKCGNKNGRLSCAEVDKQWNRLVASRAMGAPASAASAAEDPGRIRILQREESCEKYRWLGTAPQKLSRNGPLKMQLACGACMLKVCMYACGASMLRTVGLTPTLVAHNPPGDVVYGRSLPTSADRDLAAPSGVYCRSPWLKASLTNRSIA